MPDEVVPTEAPGVWKMVVLALVVVTGFMLGSGKETWSLGAIMCLVGLAIICAPPLYRLPKAAVWSLVLIALVPLVGLLPAAWFGGADSWRGVLAESWFIYVPPTLSPDPSATFESWLVVSAGVIWLWTCIGQRASEEGRRWCLYVLAIGGALIAAASWIDHSMTLIPWWPRLNQYGYDFGPFTNRNHTASLNAIGAVLCASAAYDSYRRRSVLKWLFIVLFWLPLGAIFVNTSRGGLVLLFVGLCAWATTAAMKKGLFRKLAVGAAVLLMVASVAFVSSGQLGSRLRGLLDQDKVSTVTSTLRLDLARETLSMSSASPWLGYGFDTFVPLFPMMLSEKHPTFRFLHPESDLLLLLFEGGILILVPCLILLTWIILSCDKWTGNSSQDQFAERSGRRLRQTAAIGAGMALLHSFFDVPNHVVGYALHTSLLLSLAIRPRQLQVVSSSFQRWTFRFAGVVIIGLGVLWLGIGLGKWTPDLPTSVQVLRKRISDESQKGNYRDAMRLTNRAIQIAPIDYRLYYIRGQLLLLLRQNPERALLDFGRSRFLEPNYANTCYQEGLYLLGFAPDLAIIPWREFLNRVPQLPSSREAAYGNILSTTQLYPELRSHLWALADTAEMRVIFLAHTQTKDEWDLYLAKFLALHPNLEALQPKLLRTLFGTWHNRGDRAELMTLLNENHSLQMFAWRTMSIELTREGRYEEAYFLASKYLKRQQRPALVGSANLARLERAFLFNPTDSRPGIELYFAYRGTGELKAAKATAEKLVALPDVPPYMKVELASLYAEFKDYRRAWETMEQAMYGIPDT